ncbi:MAG TPA: hypothetical protein VI454_09140 [Verrucomicrobiae bacterium]|jgi:hypothetical protein
MPIPPVTKNGVLPEGVHACSMEEVRLRFGVFQGSDRRVGLFNKLAQFVTELRYSGLFAAVVVDGSFVTTKSAPQDIDLILALPRDHNWSADLNVASYNLVSRRAVHRRFGFDVLLAADGGEGYKGYIEFFSRVREDASMRKGMLRIEL